MFFSASVSEGEEGEEGEVTVVASQLRGYGVWDGGVARGGTLLAGWEGPAPSLLFLWVTDAQANLLQRELSALRQSSASSGESLWTDDAGQLLVRCLNRRSPGVLRSVVLLPPAGVEGAAAGAPGRSVGVHP